MSLAESKTSAVSPESPWLGLRPFTEGVREYFFGRNAEVSDLFQRVVHKSLTVLFGRSGLGKTSLLQAALVPRLRDAGFLPIVLRLDYADDSAPLLRQFVDALTAALAPALPGLDEELGRLRTDAALSWVLFHDPALGLTAPEAPRPVVLLDQFEEIFTISQATSERQEAAAKFMEMLADLVENRVPETLRSRLETDDGLADRLDYAARPAKIVLCLREDFLHLLERYRASMPALMDNRFELRLLGGPQALEAVIEPGRLHCRPGTDLAPLVSEATGSAIVRFVAGVAPDIPLAEINAVPPLLSLVCAELNEQRLAAGESVIRPKQLEGRAEDILGQFYERCFSSQPSAVRTFVEDRLLSAAGFRESTTLDTATHELIRAGLTHAAAVEAIAGLVDARLLTSEERGGIRRIEITHDVLCPLVVRARKDRHERREKEETDRRAEAERKAKEEAEASAREADKRAVLLDAALKKAVASKRAAAELINFLQYDLSKKLGKLGRLGMMNAVNARIIKYYEDNPPEADDLDGLREKGVALAQQGDVQRDQGDLPSALESHRDGLRIREKLAKQDSANAEWQRDLSFSYIGIGNVLEAQGDLPGALKSYRDGFEIREKLAKQDLANAEWQHDLSVSYNKVGNVLEAQGDLPGALKSYHDSLDIAERLVKQDSANTGWQRNLSVCYSNVGDVQSAQGDLPGALESYRDSLDIAEKLAKQDSEDAGYQRALSVSYGKVGDVQSAQGDLAGALKSYRDSLDIAEKLAGQEPGNAVWQNELCQSYLQVGNVRSAQGDLAGALRNYSDGLEIAKKLAKLYPGNARWQNDDAWSRYCVAKVLIRIKEGDRNEAGRLVLEGIDIMKRIEHQGALDTHAQDTLNKLNELNSDTSLW